jgi:hypothetical protein
MTTAATNVKEAIYWGFWALRLDEIKDKTFNNLGEN